VFLCWERERRGGGGEGRDKAPANVFCLRWIDAQWSLVCRSENAKLFLSKICQKTLKKRNNIFNSETIVSQPTESIQSVVKVFEVEQFRRKEFLKKIIKIKSEIVIDRSFSFIF
jgi:hypothetical protein